MQVIFSQNIGIVDVLVIIQSELLDVDGGINFWAFFCSTVTTTVLDLIDHFYDDKSAAGSSRPLTCIYRIASAPPYVSRRGFQV
jgi:hypothetical protein